MLSLEPAGPQAKLHSPPAHLIHLGDGDCQWPRQPERGAGHQGAKADAGRLGRESGEGRPGVGRARLPGHRPHLEVVVGAEEGVEAELFGGLRNSAQRGVRGALLGLGEDPQSHGLILAYGCSIEVDRHRRPS